MLQNVCKSPNTIKTDVTEKKYNRRRRGNQPVNDKNKSLILNIYQQFFLSEAIS